MAFPSIELLDRRQRLVDPPDELRGVDESQIVGGERGEQAEADVGRRGAVRDRQVRAPLDVVRWKMMILWPDERLEIRPRSPGDLLEVVSVRRRQCRAA